MLEFVIDKSRIDGNSWEDIADKQEQPQDFDSEEDEFCNLITLDDLCNLEGNEKKKKKERHSADDFSLGNTYLITNYTKELPYRSSKSCVDKVLKKAVLTPAIEKQKAVSVSKGKKALKKERKAEREKTKGKDWFNLPATEVTKEIKNDLEILGMRSALDSKQFYKKNDRKVIPKYFQIGKVVEGAADFYSGRIPKSQRKKTLVDELLADSSFKAYQKKKYKEIVDVNRRKRSKRSVPEKKNKKSYKDDWLKFD